MYTCFECQDVFNDYLLFLKHCTLSHKNQDYTCNECFITFGSLKSFKKHIKTKHFKENVTIDESIITTNENISTSDLSQETYANKNVDVNNYSFNKFYLKLYS